jgi:hypothetical protein
MRLTPLQVPEQVVVFPVFGKLAGHFFLPKTGDFSGLAFQSKKS